MIGVWRIICEGGEVVDATVSRARETGSVAACHVISVWRAERLDVSVPYYAREASGDTPRSAVTALAGRGGLGVVAIVGPGDAPFPEDVLRSLVAALDAYAATDGRPWAERIAARKRVDEARAAVASTEGWR